MQTDDEITCRIQRSELLGLLHEQTEQQHAPITARMPAVTLELLLVEEPFEQPFEEPFKITLERAATGTGPVEPLVDAVIHDDIEPELSVAIGRVTSQAINAVLDKAIDDAVAERITMEIDAVVVEAEPGRFERLLPMFVGFAVTLVAGLGLMLVV